MKPLKLFWLPACSAEVKTLLSAAAALTAFLSAHLASAADSAEREAVQQLILARDAEFWTAYNTCDTSHYDRYFTSDVEFYHDKGGATFGLDALTNTTKKNLCGGPKPRIRREAVPDTARISLLENNGQLYGAILSGEHLFFALEADKPPRLTGRARYTHLWLKRDGDYKMARILSYDHGPASESPRISTVSLTSAQLDRLAGKFSAAKSGEISISREDDHLALEAGGKRMSIYPTNETTFSLKDRDVSFEFHFAQGALEKLIIRERGEVVDEATPLR